MTMIPNQYDESGCKPEPNRLLLTINYFLQGLKDRNADGDISDQHYRDDVERVEDLEKIYKLLESHASTPTREVTEEELEKYAEEESVIHSMGYPERSDKSRTLIAKDSFIDGFKSCYHWIKSLSNTREVEGGWISVEDEHPEHETGSTGFIKCLALLKDGTEKMVEYNMRTEKFQNIDHIPLENYITHWKPTSVNSKEL